MNTIIFLAVGRAISMLAHCKVSFEHGAKLLSEQLFAQQSAQAKTIIANVFAAAAAAAATHTNPSSRGKREHVDTCNILQCGRRQHSADRTPPPMPAAPFERWGFAGVGWCGAFLASCG